MHVFHFNLPWVIDDKEYNCSSRPLSEWTSRGSVNIPQGVYFMTGGVFFVVLYSLCLLGMFRGHLLNYPCYRLMFFNGIVDIADLCVNSLIASYFHLTGSVFCSEMIFNWIVGHLAWSLWCGATINCLVLALNRIAEMIPSCSCFLFLFRGKLLYLWMILSLVNMIVQAFLARPILYNTAVSAFTVAPMISDDVKWEISHYTVLLVPIHNITVLVLITLLYSILCTYVLRFGQLASGGIDKVQVQLFVQALLICTTTVMTASLYVYLALFDVPPFIFIATNVVWQLNHGLHGIIYIFFNKHIRREIIEMRRLALKYVLNLTIRCGVTTDSRNAWT